MRRPQLVAALIAAFVATLALSACNADTSVGLGDFCLLDCGYTGGGGGGGGYVCDTLTPALFVYSERVLAGDTLSARAVRCNSPVAPVWSTLNAAVAITDTSTIVVSGGYVFLAEMRAKRRSMHSGLAVQWGATAVSSPIAVYDSSDVAIVELQGSYQYINKPITVSVSDYVSIYPQLRLADSTFVRGQPTRIFSSDTTIAVLQGNTVHARRAGLVYIIGEFLNVSDSLGVTFQ